MLKRTLHYVTLCLVAFAVLGCSSPDTTDPPPVPGTLPTPFPGFTFPRLDLANSVIPLPNDLLRNPATGNLNFPGTTEPSLAGNSLNGFSTSGAIIIPFRGTVVPTSVTNGTLPVFNTVTGQRALMSYSVSTNATGSVVTAVPVLALDHSTRYVVVTTDGIISALSGSPILSDSAINILKRTQPLVDGNGNTTFPAISNAQAAQLEPVRLAYQPIWAAAEQLTGRTRAEIPLAFAFTTQTLFQALPAARADVVAANAAAIPANVTAATALMNPAGATVPVAVGNSGLDARFMHPLAGPLPFVDEFFATLPAPANSAPNAAIGRIQLGAVPVPIYRTDRAEGFWANPPVQVGTQNVPFLLFLPRAVRVPNAANPPIPAVIFQHGITRSSRDAVVLAKAVNTQNLALIAIDLEKHGSLKVDPASATDGDGFINVPNLRNSRDNIRQSVVNLYGLTQAIVSGQTNIDGIAGPELAPGPALGGRNPVYLATSLGAIVGDVFHATEPNITASALNVGGARVTNILLQSQTFRQPIIDGLAAAGVAEGTTQFAQFFLIAQAVLDDADPVNYADQATSGALRGGTGAQILQQVNTTDTVVPPVSQYDMARQHANGVGSPPFAQVDALAAQAGIPQVSTPHTGAGFYEIPNAGHGALLSPAQGPTVAIVTQALNYLGTALAAGNGVIINSNIRARQIPVEVLDDADYSRVIKF